MSFSRVARIEIPLPVVRREGKEMVGEEGKGEEKEEEEEEGASFVTRNPPWTN